MSANPLSFLHRYDVNMIVKHGLAGSGSVGLDDPDTVWRQRFLRRAGDALDGSRRGEQIGLGDFQQVGGMGFGNHQRVARTGRLNVHEGQGVVVLVNFDRRNVAPDDLAEDTVGGFWHGA